MNDHAEQLAREFEQANQELISLIERIGDEHLRVQCGDDERNVAVVAHHVAHGHGAIAEWVQAIANGQPIGADMAMVHAANRDHSARYADVDRVDVLTALRTNGDVAAEILRGLSDDQLRRRVPVTLFGGQEMTAAEVAERILIGHIHSHMGDINAAIGA